MKIVLALRLYFFIAVFSNRYYRWLFIRSSTYRQTVIAILFLIWNEQIRLYAASRVEGLCREEILVTGASIDIQKGVLSTHLWKCNT